MKMKTENIETENQLTPEQAADLAALNNQATQGEQAVEQAQAVQAEKVSITQVDELTGIIFATGNILGAKFPSLLTVYTEERSRAVAQNINPVFVKFGWNITGGDFAMFSGAIMAVAMLITDTKDAIKTDLEQMALKQQVAEELKTA